MERAVMHRLAVLAIAAGLLFAVSAAAAPEPMHITGSRYLFQTVEQQGHIVNDTGCAWDPDDSVSVQAQGYLEGGFQIATCVIADSFTHLLGLDFRAPQSRPFVATVEVGTHTLSWNSVADGKYQRVKACLTTPDYDASFPFPPVGAGVGVPTSILWTMQVERKANSATMVTQLLANHSGHQAELCGTTYTVWPHCEGDPFVDGRVCYQ